jgi:hypothetical protein
MVRNGTESDKDCGGSCTPCGTGLVCNAAADCQSGNCSGGHCLAPSCMDTLKNGDETGSDCGGSCPACAASQGCAKPADCQSLVCAPSKMCAAATCNDKVKNGSESEIDCGTGCSGCQAGQHCNVVGDCASKLCKQNYCLPTTPSGGALVMSTWTATASDTFANSSPGSGIDNKSTTRWSSGVPQYTGMWFSFDMKAPQIFFSLTLDSQDQPSDTPILFDVYLSMDGTFSTATAKSIAGDASGLTQVPLGGAQIARYVKIVLTNNKPASWWGIRDLTVNN